MSPLILLLALFAQAPAADGAAPEPAPATAAAPAPSPYPPGAPREDYPFVAWCYGALRGYLEMHDEVMPEVTRIETTYRAPGSKLADDLKVYADQQRAAREDLKRFQAALTAAEKASLRPINALGAESVRKGRAVWTSGPDTTKARKAQEWMSWTLPALCQTKAASLEESAKLMGSAFKVNAEPEAAPAPAEPAPAPEAQPAEAPAATPNPAG
jgi:hypothetical protein